MKSYLIFATLIVALLYGPLSSSQGPSSENPQYRAESDLLIIRFVPGDKKAKIFLAGTKRATFDFNKDAKILSVVMMNDNQREELALAGQGTSYFVERSSPFPPKYEILFNAQVHGKLEKIKLQINKSKP